MYLVDTDVISDARKRGSHDRATGIGRLPNEAPRKRMAALVDSLPERAWK